MESLEIDPQLILIMIMGILISAAFWVRILSKQITLPPIAGYILIGFLFRIVQDKGYLSPVGATELLLFLGEIGIVILLFRVGISYHLEKLLQHLREASFFAFTNIIISGLAGYFATRWVLGYSLIPSLFVATSLTATSIGVTVMIWKQEKLLQTSTGKLLLDMAALDDIVAIALMGLLFAIAPILRAESYDNLIPTILATTGLFTIKLTLFIICCFFFSYMMKTGIMRFLNKFGTSTDPLLMTVSTGLIIAATAGIFGFSIALGAFFAGISFSGSAKSEKIERSLNVMEELFTPFFFIGIGLQVTPEVFTSNHILTLTLIIAAVTGKVVGTFIPARISGFSIARSNILGVSMMPRAEISMVLIAKGLQLGPWAVPEITYSSMVMVSFFTCLITPFTVRRLLKNNKEIV